VCVGGELGVEGGAGSGIGSGLGGDGGVRGSVIFLRRHTVSIDMKTWVFDF